MSFKILAKGVIKKEAIIKMASSKGIEFRLKSYAVAAEDSSNF